MEIRIGPRGMGLAMLGLLAAAGGMVALQLPELKRYLKIKEM
jgi:hypothetical protein